MSYRKHSSETKTLYLTFTDGFVEESAVVECDGHTDDDSFVNVTFTPKVRDALVEKGAGTAVEVEAVLNRLGFLLSEESWAEIGETDIQGWYEPPTICWSDPSCSDPGDGEITAIEVHLNDPSDIEESIKATIETAVIHDFEANNLAKEKYNPNEPQSTEYMITKALEGEEMLGEVNVAVYLKVIEVISGILADEIYEVDGDNIL
jgi:hypothetical protein